MDRSELIASIMEHEPKTVVEFCCGTGWIPKGLPHDVQYWGIDANQGCYDLAVKKNPDRNFMRKDVRNVDVEKELFPCDMALAFSCLKHFSLAEWDSIYSKVLQSGKRTLTSIYMRPRDVEDPGHGFPHSAVTMERVQRVIEENGHRLVKVFTLPPLNKHPEPLVLTEAVDDGTSVVSSEGIREDDSERGVHLREGVLGGVSPETGDPGGEDPDAPEGEPDSSVSESTEWPM